MDGVKHPRPRRVARVLLICQLLIPLSYLKANGSGYVGREACAACHEDIAATQARTNMARTWQGQTPRLPANYSQERAEGPEPAIQYELKETGGKLEYRVQMPGKSAQDFRSKRRLAVIGMASAFCYVSPHWTACPSRLRA